MDFLCRICDRSFIQSESEYIKYLTTLRKKNNKSLYKKLTINNVDLDEINQILNDHISTHKKISVFLIKCDFVIEFDNNFMATIETNCFYNTDIIIINRYLIYDINCFKSRGYRLSIINRMTINSISDRCNMTYENYINQLMTMCERKINFNFAKNPHLINSLDRNKDHPSIRKYSHLPFNN